MKQPTISLIAAISENRALGNENKLLWSIPEDMKRFKTLTLNHPVIMGRKTFESIGRRLPNRTNIIVTRDFAYVAEGCIITHSLKEAIDEAKSFLSSPTRSGISSRSEMQILEVPKPANNVNFDSRPKGTFGLRGNDIDGDEIFIIGGGQIYTQAINCADKLYLTIVKGNFTADTYFPDYSDFTTVVYKKESSDQNHEYTFLELEPKQGHVCKIPE